MSEVDYMAHRQKMLDTPGLNLEQTKSLSVN